MNQKLTPEERKDRAAKILARYILKAIKEKRKQSTMVEGPPADTPPAPTPKGT